MSEIEFLSPLKPEECAIHLQQAAPARTLASVLFRLPQGTVWANVQGMKFRLYAEGPPLVGNAYAPFFYGRLESSGDGTRISGMFRFSPFTRAFMAVWFGFVILVGLFCLLALTASVIGPRIPGQASPLIGVLATSVMLTLGYSIVRFGKWMGRQQEVKMLEFIESALHARVEEQHVAPDCQ